MDLIDMGEEFRAVIPALDPLFLNLSGVPAKKLEAMGGFGWVCVSSRNAIRAVMSSSNCSTVP